MYLTQLADIARRAGLAVKEQPGWKTRGHGPMTDVHAIVCHHTAGGAGNAASLDVVQNGRSDLAGPLAHFLLAEDGTVYVVAAGLCYHAGAVLNPLWGNAHAIGIEAERSMAAITARTPWPEAQLRAYARLARALSDAFGAAVLGHKEVCAPPGRKIDPDFDMAAFRGRVATATQEDDVELTDKVTLYGTEGQASLNNVLAGIFGNAKDALAQLKSLNAAVAGLNAAVAKLATNPDITVEQMRELVNNAVAEHVQITGTVQIGAKP